jgi:hypothetical protein
MVSHSCIIVNIFVIHKNYLVDFGWWSSCTPQEIPDAIRKAISTFNHYLIDDTNEKVRATRKEIFDKMLDVFDEIANEEDENLAMGYPKLGVKGRIALETVEETNAYMVLTK